MLAVGLGLFFVFIVLEMSEINYKANFPGILKEHVESVHEGVHYPCDQCDYESTTKGKLWRHKKSSHS